MRPSISLVPALVLSSIAILFAPPRARAGEDGPPQDMVEITKDLDKAVERGTAWLAKNQGHDGSWGSEGSSGQYKMVMTGLAGLALLSAGNQPGRGQYGGNITRAAEFYPAEDYHQDYYLKNPLRYKYYRSGCGRDNRLKQLWGKAPE